MYRTFVVLGNMRGGTSMVSGLLRILGVNMGDNIDEKNHEDLDLQHRHYLHMRDLVEEKNNKYDVWGWKDPMLIDNIYDVIDLCPLRNPLYIVVFRDAVATAEALCREEGWEETYAFNHVFRQTEKLFDFVSEYRPITLSYEKAINKPRECVESISKKTGIFVPEKTMERAVEFIGPGYKAI